MDTVNEYDPIIASFFDESGKLTAFPSKRTKKIACLEWLAKKFDPERIYTEKEVNAILIEACTFQDPETLRRELWGYGYLNRNRDGTNYARGPVGTGDHVTPVGTGDHVTPVGTGDHVTPVGTGGHVTV